MPLGIHIEKHRTNTIPKEHSPSLCLPPSLLLLLSLSQTLSRLGISLGTYSLTDWE